MNGPFTEADVVAAWEFLFGEERTRTGRLNRTLSELWDALDVAYRSAASRPDGWVACPREANDPCNEAWPMIEAMSHTIKSTERPSGICGMTNDAHLRHQHNRERAAYTAMLAASPYALKESDQ